MQRKYDHLPENIGDIKRVANLQKWIPIVTECCNSGQSKKSWCEERGIDVKSYFYYQKKVEYSALKQTSGGADKSDSCSGENRHPNRRSDTCEL